MKVKLKNTGEIINIADHAMVTLDACNSMGISLRVGFDEVEEFLDDNGLPLGFEKKMNAKRPIILEPTPTVDWEQRRYEIAKEAMTAIMSNKEYYNQAVANGDSVGCYHIPTSVSVAAIEFADALVKELKIKQNESNIQTNR